MKKHIFKVGEQRSKGELKLRIRGQKNRQNNKEHDQNSMRVGLFHTPQIKTLKVSFTMLWSFSLNRGSCLESWTLKATNVLIFLKSHRGGKQTS